MDQQGREKRLMIFVSVLWQNGCTILV